MNAIDENGIATIKGMIERHNNLGQNIEFMCSAFTYKQLADAGLRVEAIRRYRNENGSTLASAKAAVDAYIIQGT